MSAATPAAARYYLHGTDTRTRYYDARHNARYAQRRWYQTLKDAYATLYDRESAAALAREMLALVPGGMRHSATTVLLPGWHARRSRVMAARLLVVNKRRIADAVDLLDAWNRAGLLADNDTRH